MLYGGIARNREFGPGLERTSGPGHGLSLKVCMGPIWTDPQFILEVTMGLFWVRLRPDPDQGLDRKCMGICTFGYRGNRDLGPCAYSNVQTKK